METIRAVCTVLHNVVTTSYMHFFFEFESVGVHMEKRTGPL
jgi:hypothetical protein